jgi:cobalamin transport system substrate-binding protein
MFRMFKHVRSVLFIALLTGLFSGCDTKDSVPAVVSSSSSTFPLTITITITDRLDRKVTFEKAPTRIVSLTPSMTEMIYFLGAEDRLVGVTSYCNYPPEAQTKEIIGGGTLDSLSREKIVALEPDLVLCKWDNHEPLIAQLDEWKIPSLAFGAESFEGMYDEIKLLGRITETSDRAEAGVLDLKQRVAFVLDRVAKRTGPAPKVFYQVWDDPLMSAGPNSFIGQLLVMAGAENLLADTEIRYPKVNPEIVIARNPDVIIAPSVHSIPITPESITSREVWKHLDAVKNQRVYIIDGDSVSRCAPRLVDALEAVVKDLYGETFLTEDAP